MSDCSTNAFNTDTIRGRLHYEGSMRPSDFTFARMVNGKERVPDHFELDGVRYERVRGCAPEWDGQWFRCGCCGERLDRFGVRTTQTLSGTTMRSIAEPLKRCPNCGAKVVH